MAGMQELLQQEHCLFLTQVDTIWRIVFRPLQSAFISVKVFPGCMSVCHPPPPPQIQGPSPVKCLASIVITLRLNPDLRLYSST